MKRREHLSVDTRMTERAITRRTIAKGLMWGAPAVIAATQASPAAAAEEDLVAHLSDLDRLSATFAEIGSLKEQRLTQQLRASKGGVIGVGDKGVIAFRYDDYHTAFNTTTYPLHTARGLPAGFASISRLDQQPWSSATAPATIKGWNQNGVEIHSHGVDHKDPSPQGDAGIVDQVVNSRAEIEAWGVKCQGWMQPGATAVGAATPYGTTFTAPADLDTFAGRLIRQTYGMSEAYLVGEVRTLPFAAYHGLNHITVSDGMTLTVAKSWVDRAVERKLGIEFMCHSGNLGTGSNMTVADYTAFLDYVVTKWEAGLIEVLTPSGLAFADKSSSRLDLLINGSFENSTTNVIETYGWGLAATVGTVMADGGRTGPKYLRQDVGIGNGVFCNQRPDSLGSLGLGGETFLFEGWARSSAGTSSRVLLRDYTDISRLSLTLTRNIPAGNTWTRVRHAFSLAPRTTTLSVGLGRTNGQQIDWDDVSVKKV